MGKTIAEQSRYIGTQLGQAEIGYKAELNKWGLGKTLGFGFGRPKEEADFYKGAEKDIIEDVFKGDMNAYRGFLASAAKDPVLAQKDFQETLRSGELQRLAASYQAASIEAPQALEAPEPTVDSEPAVLAASQLSEAPATEKIGALHYYIDLFQGGTGTIMCADFNTNKKLVDPLFMTVQDREITPQAITKLTRGLKALNPPTQLDIDAAKSLEEFFEECQEAEKTINKWTPQQIQEAREMLQSTVDEMTQTLNNPTPKPEPTQEKPEAEPIVVPQTSIIDAMGSATMPYDPKVEALQEKLAALDPKYKEMMEYTKADGSMGCIDGLAGDRTRRAVTEFIINNNLSITDMSIEDLTARVDAALQQKAEAEAKVEDAHEAESVSADGVVMAELPPGARVESTGGANRPVGEAEVLDLVHQGAAARVQPALYSLPDTDINRQFQI